MKRLAVVAILGAAACGGRTPSDARNPEAGIDSLNALLIRAYRTHDPRLYGTVFTDSAVFEWPALSPVRGRSALETMATSNWSALAEMDLRVSVDRRYVQGDRATEFGAFEQSWRDPKGARMTEYGRYVTVLARQADGRWLIDRFLGFEDSLRPPATPVR